MSQAIIESKAAAIERWRALLHAPLLRGPRASQRCGWRAWAKGRGLSWSIARRCGCLAPKPFATLEVQPHNMSDHTFGLYGNALARDTWVYSWAAGPEHARRADQDGVGAANPQQQAAVLPVSVFRDFVCRILHRFRGAERHARAAGNGTLFGHVQL